MQKIADLKIKIYEEKENQSTHILIGLAHSPEYFKKEFQKLYIQENTSPWLIYAINLYEGQEFEQMLKKFIEAHISQPRAPQVFSSYLKKMGMTYDWLPKEILHVASDNI